LLIVDPDGSAMKLINSGRHVSENQTRACLDVFIPEIQHETTNANRLLTMRCNHVPCFIISMIDEYTDEGAIYVTACSFKQVDPHRPSMRITKREPMSFNFFLNEFEDLWKKNAAEAQCK
jgi:hypothetical protein